MGVFYLMVMKESLFAYDMYEGIAQILDEAVNDEQLVLLSLIRKEKFYSSGADLSDGRIRLKNFIITKRKLIIKFRIVPSRLIFYQTLSCVIFGL
jgi:hypothetical protein